MKRERDDDDGDDDEQQLLDHIMCGAYAAAMLWLKEHPKANVNYTDGDGKSLLYHVCTSGSSKAHKVAQHLLRKGAPATAEALFRAARVGRSRVVAALLEHGAPAEAIDADTGNTPLIMCCSRRAFSGASVARMLLVQGGANPSGKGGKSGKETPLLCAAQFGTPQLVQLLLEHGASPRETSAHGFSTIMRAVLNRKHAAEIIPILLAAGANQYDRSRMGSSALSLAMQTTGAVMRQVGDICGLYGKDLLAGHFPSLDCSDPVGVIREAARFGCVVKPFDITKTSRKRRATAEYVWAIMRCANGRTPSTVVADPLRFANKFTTSPSLWYWTARECVYRDSVNGDTLLHSAVRSGSSANVRRVMDTWANPFARNHAGETPLQLAATPEMRSNLLRYQQQTLRREVADWYGPYFIGRARALLLVMLRWRTTRHERNICVPPRGVIYMILDALRAVEYV